MKNPAPLPSTPACGVLGIDDVRRIPERARAPLGRIRPAELQATLVVLVFRQPLKPPAASLGLTAGLAVVSESRAQDGAAPVPAEQTAAAFSDTEWEVPRFSWGDPNLEGTFTSRDMTGIPMSRPEEYGTREH